MSTKLGNYCLYKAKRTDNDEWIEGFPYQIADNLNPFIMIPNSHGESHEVDIRTLCRSLGCKDFHRKTIFDKDIIEFTFKSGNKEKYLLQWLDEGQEFTAMPLNEEKEDIVWCEKYFVNFGDRINWSTFILMLQDPYGDISDIKVHGNYINSPELVHPEFADFKYLKDTEENVSSFNF